MNAFAEFKMVARHQPMTHVGGGALLMPRQFARGTSDLYWLSARSASANAKDDKAIFPTSACASRSATDQRELLIGQCHRVLRFVLFGTMFYLDRLHVVHLRRMTDRFVRKHSLSDPGGGAVKKYLTLAV